MIVPQRGYTEHLAYRCVPRDVPEPPSTANDHHQQQPASMKLVQALSLRATHENTLVMRSSVACQGDGTGFLPRERDHLAS